MADIPGVSNGGAIQRGPTTNGTDGQVLTGDGAGNVGFEDVPSPDLSALVHLAGVETITGVKTFSADPIFWNVKASNSFYFHNSNLLMWATPAIGDTGNAYTFMNENADDYRQIKASSLWLSGGIVSSQDASGANTAATNLTIQPGQSTGNATPAKVIIQGTSAGSSGSSAQTLVDLMTFQGTTATLTGTFVASGTLQAGYAGAFLGSVITNKLFSGDSNDIALILSDITRTIAFTCQFVGGNFLMYGDYLSGAEPSFIFGTYSNKTNQIVCKPSGRVGIGTAAPDERLHVAGSIKTDGGFIPASMADGSAAISTIYYSTTASKLVFKDSGGVVNALY